MTLHPSSDDLGRGAGAGRLRNVEDVYPLSPIQEGLLFHSLAQPDVADPYVQQLYCRIQGPLDVSLLRRAFRIVVGRHTILRTAFLWESLERPLQVVREQAEPPFETRDWSGLSSTEQEGLLAELIAADRRKGFNLSRSPLLRVTAIQVAPECFDILWTLHHLVIDGWSTALVLGEVFEVYTAARRGELRALDPAIPFKHYIAWIKRQHASEAQSFFTPMLGSARGRPAFWSHRRGDALPAGERLFGEEERLVSGSALAALYGFLREQRVTLGTLLTGVWALLLGRHQGCEQVVVGSTVSGREARVPGIESMVGVFINSLPVAVSFEAGRAVGDWLGELQATLAAARSFESTSLAQIRDWIDAPASVPLLESIVVVDTYPMDAVSGAIGGELSVERVHLSSPNSFPLSIKAQPGDPLSLLIKFDRRCVPDEVARELAQQLQCALRSLVENPRLPLSDVRLAPSEQSERRVLEWARPAESTAVFSPVHERIAAQAARDADAPAVLCSGGWLSYGELDRRSDALAARLCDLGAGPEVLVALCLDRWGDLLAGLLGVLKAGAAYVPIDMRHSSRCLAQVLAESGIALAVTAQRLVALVEGSGAASVSLESCDDGARPSEKNATPETLACGVLSADAGGQRRLALVDHGQLASRLGAQCALLDPYPGDHHASLSTPSSDLGHATLFPALATGGCLHLLADGDALEPRRLVQYFERSRIDHLAITPTDLDRLVSAGGGASFLPERTLRIGGEPLSWALWDSVRRRAPRCRVFHVYAAGEATGATLHSTGGNASTRSCSATVPLGRPFGNAQVLVADERGRPSPTFVPGEILVHGACVARGWLDRPDLLQERVEGDPRAVATGDRARLLPDGEVELLGPRAADGGGSPDLAALERELLRHPRVRQAAAVVERETGGVPQLVAYVSAEDASPELGASLESFVRARLPRQLVPSRVIPVAGFRRTASGRLDRDALLGATPAGAGTDSPPRAPAAPPTARDTGERVASIWRDLFPGAADVGPHSDFYELGGHSLLALRLTSRLRREFGVELTLPRILRAATVGGQVELIRGLLPAGTGAAPTPESPAGRSAVHLLSRRPWELGEQVSARLASAVPDVERVYGLSPVQLDMLEAARSPELRRLNPSHRFIELRGALEPAALEAALTHLIQRHAALRTCFRWDEAGNAAQVVLRSAPAEIRWEDWSGAAPRARESALADHVRDERERGFELREAPLLRVSMLRIEDDRYWLSWFVHHIVSDRWSAEILFEDLLGIYDAICRGEAPAPEAFPPFHDYVSWLSRQDFAATERYWRARLEDFDTPTLSRLGRSGEPGSGLEIESAGATLDAGLAARIAQRARGMRVTPAAIVHGAWALALCQASGLEDTVFGSIVAGRPVDLEGSERMVGLFLNVLPVRVHVDGSLPVADWLRRLHEEQLAALEFDFVPPRDLDAWACIPDGTRLLESVVVYQSMAFRHIRQRSGALRVERVWTPDHGPTQIPLIVEVEAEPELLVRLAWHSDRFDRPLCESLLRHLVRNVTRIAREPLGPLRELAAADHESVRPRRAAGAGAAP